MHKIERLEQNLVPRAVIKKYIYTFDINFSLNPKLFKQDIAKILILQAYNQISFSSKKSSFPKNIPKFLSEKIVYPIKKCCSACKTLRIL